MTQIPVVQLRENDGVLIRSEVVRKAREGGEGGLHRGVGVGAFISEQI